MQQTEKYKLNLIESSDPFLPDGLNQNTQKIETAMAAHEAKLDGQISAIVQNLGIHGHNARIAWGSYTGTGISGQDKPSVFSFGFAPVVMWVNDLYLCKGVEKVASYYTAMASDSTAKLTHYLYPSWLDDGISWYATDGAAPQLNLSGTVYRYVAIGYDKSAEEA